ncbi:hypothetical protein Pyn_25102 [Prunus yedoensis var. nudiflora]|uniref:Uncharacterized protein n=1 Tax=Prunus yedoensis var. nudiflora TaxID=2094558 RepID=A0A314ZV37_PRUYE|nr:hypothetical protein Pyn_25102 [Prunus yedoensis var. nudiflora]
MSFRSLTLLRLFDEVEGFGLWFWTDDHLRKMIDEFEQIKQQLAECLGIP